MRIIESLSRRLLHGPAPALPPALDRIADAWAGLGARPRLLVRAAAVLALVAAAAEWSGSVDARWGGEPVPVLVATTDLPPGAEPTDLRRLAYPPAAVPPGAVAEVPEGARLAFALPAGGVLTSAHLDPRGPARGLAAGARAVPIPVDESWGLEAGGWVDVWVLAGDDQPARLIARACPVLRVDSGDAEASALVGVPAGAVREVAEGLALGRILLAHAPPPGAASPGGTWSSQAPGPSG